jgi:ketosteroid isomerase-like protein
MRFSAVDNHVQATSSEADRFEGLWRGQMKALLVLLMFSASATAQMNEAGLLKLDREFAKATSERRLDGWMRYMMDATVVFGPPHSAQRIVGRAEIRNYYRDMFGMPDFNMSWTPRTAQLLPSRETGYTMGTFHWVSPNYKCHCVNDWRGTYVAVWEEENCPGGTWKLKALFPSLEKGSSSCGCGS